jgi:hypothetical protein
VGGGSKPSTRRPTGTSSSMPGRRVSRATGALGMRFGAKTPIGDEDLTERNRSVITTIPVSGMGRRKVRTHFRRGYQLYVGKNQFLRHSRKADLRAGVRPSPTASQRRRAFDFRLHFQHNLQLLVSCRLAYSGARAAVIEIGSDLRGRGH